MNKKVQNFEKSFALLFFVPIFAIPNERETNNRGVAQLASASGLGPEGPVFESQYPDIIKNDYLKSSGRFFVITHL